MKKILSLIGALGLTTTASMSAIACVIKVPEKPFFNNIRDINQNSWNLETKEFLPSEIITETNTWTDVSKDTYFYQSVINDFKNKEDVDKYFTENTLQYRVNDSETLNGFTQYYLSLRISKQETNIVNNLVIKAFEGKTRLSLNQSEIHQVNLNQQNEDDQTNTENFADEIYQELTHLANLYKNVYKNHSDKFPERFILDQFINLHRMLRVAVVTTLEKTYLPNFNSEENIFYENIAQQLKYLDEAFPSMDNSLFTNIKDLDQENVEIRKGLVRDKIKSLSWQNITVNLTS